MSQIQHVICHGVDPFPESLLKNTLSFVSLTALCAASLVEILNPRSKLSAEFVLFKVCGLLLVVRGQAAGGRPCSADSPALRGATPVCRAGLLALEGQGC